jgi:Hypoxia induced protein conserved region
MRATGGGRTGSFAKAMGTAFSYVITIALIAVLAVLLFGFWNMLRGSPQTSQKLMRWRVILQFVAIIIIVLAVLLQRS